MGLYKLYGTGVTDNIANLDVVQDGRIIGVKWAAYGDLDADGESFSAELSFASASGHTTNDTKSSISGVRALAMDTGTAASNKKIAVNQFDGPLNVPVKQGERLYLHATGNSFTGSVWIYTADGIEGGRQSGRRVRL